MAAFLSPGVFPREIDLSVIPSSAGPLRPAFIGAAKKGPMNEVVFITSAQQYVDTFGEPFPESYLGYAVIAFFEEGNQCYVMRVGVECEDGQDPILADICVDTSGSRGAGWGRIPVFTGIDYGRINLRAVSTTKPLTFHDSAVADTSYHDATVSSTDGATTAAISTTGTYTGAIDDTFTMIITSAPTVSDAAKIDGAGFQVIRNSDGEVIASGLLVDDNADGVSNYVSLGNGLSVRVTVTAGVLDENDTFTFSVRPANRKFTISVNGATGVEYTMPATSYTTAAAFVTAFNALLSSEHYLLVEYTLADGSTIPQLRTTVAGSRIQLMGSEAFALEVGSQLYAWDIPRSYLLGLDSGTFDITAQNNRVKINVISDSETNTVEFTVPVGNDQTVASVAGVIDAAGIVSGVNYWDSFALTVPGGATHVVIVVADDYELSTLQVLANYSNLKTLHFAETLNIPYPYKRSYRGFSDNRLVLPDSGAITSATPLSCETDPSGDDCALDTAYFASIVGWFVAPSAGTWVDGYTVTMEVFTEGLGNISGRYKLTIRDAATSVLDVIQDVTFDKTLDRYVGNVLNPGTKYGGVNGNAYLNWDERPAFLDNDPNTADYTVRYPSQFSAKTFNGQANGIPTDPAFSSSLDSAVIGNPATSTGLYAFQNPEAYDINLLAVPGFSTGAVIGTGLQVCEARGDVLYIVDPPFGLRPQQVVDWHNGMLVSDLNAAINSSYGALYWSWLQINDQFGGNKIWIPPSGHVTAVFSRTARDTEQWFSPAGLRRGRLLTALDVEYSPSRGEQDLLYGSGNAVNPVIKFPQDGITVWGQRTLQRTDSALNRISVRMLLIYIKKNLTRTLRTFIHEPNDRILWRQVEATINPFLADIQSRRGLQAYSVVVNESNNTPERGDRGELWVSIFLKPERTVEFIALNLVTLRTGASFSAEEVLAAGGIVTAATAT